MMWQQPGMRWPCWPRRNRESNEQKYFGTDGVRGRVGQSPITPDFVMRLGYAAGKVLLTWSACLTASARRC
jgi:phosphomannomutase